jgi:hypothetical protein
MGQLDKNAPKTTPKKKATATEEQNTFNMNLSLNIENFKMIYRKNCKPRLYSERVSPNEIFSMVWSSMSLHLQSYKFETIVSMELAKFNLIDNECKDYYMRNFITTSVDQSIAEFLHINKCCSPGDTETGEEARARPYFGIVFKTQDRSSPNYNNTVSQLDMEFGYFFLHLRPTVMHRLILLMIPDYEIQPENLEDSNARIPPDLQDHESEMRVKQAQDAIVRTINEGLLKDIPSGGDPPTTDNDHSGSPTISPEKTPQGNPKDPGTPEQDSAPQEKILGKMQGSQQINFLLRLRFSQISVVLINEIHNMYQTHLSATNLNVTITDKLEKKSIQCL